MEGEELGWRVGFGLKLGSSLLPPLFSCFISDPALDSGTVDAGEHQLIFSRLQRAVISSYLATHASRGAAEVSREEQPVPLAQRW